MGTRNKGIVALFGTLALIVGVLGFSPGVANASPPSPPTVITGAASNITQSSATLNGTVNPNGSTATCHFNYGLSTSYGSVTPNAGFGNGHTAVPVSANITGLAANTQYHFQLECFNNKGDVKGADAVFTTNAVVTSPPVVTTGAASGITSSGAILNGTVNPDGLATTCHFNFGTSTAYGSVTPNDTSPGSGNSTVPVSATLTGLLASTDYHFQLECSNSAGDVTGNDAVFTTFATAQPPAVITGSASGVTDTAATLNGTVNPESLSTTYHFEYGTTTAYGTSIPVPEGSAGGGSIAVAESAAVTGLTASTTYHFRLDATNSAGTTLGSDATFTTNATAPSGVLTRSGATLMLNSVPYRTVGTNAYGLATCDGLTYSSADLDAFFQALRPESLTRFWVTKRATVAQIDLIVQRAAANNQMLIMSLIDGPNNCNASGDTVDANFILMTSATYTSYVNWINTLVPRYVNSPAVGMWELGNELDGQGGSVTPAQMAAFNQTVATHIKSLDSSHLVESGIAGNIGSCCNQTGTNFKDSQNAAALDVISMHEYQYDQSGNVGVHTSWSTYLAASVALNKPLIVGEVGALLYQPTNTLCHDSTHTIEWLLQQKFDAYLSNGASAVIGWNWMKSKPSWVGTTCTANQHFYYGTTNPVVTLIHNYVIP